MIEDAVSRCRGEDRREGIGLRIRFPCDLLARHRARLRPATRVCDANYLTVRWAGDTYLFAKGFTHLIGEGS